MKAFSTVGAGLSRVPAPMGLGGRARTASGCGLAGIATTKYTWATHEEAPMEDEVRVAATTTGVAQVFDLHALKAFARTSASGRCSSRAISSGPRSPATNRDS